MNTNRTAVIGGTAALLLVLTGCAGAEGQFDDSARAESAQQRVAAGQSQLSAEQVDRAIEAYEQLRDSRNAEFQAQSAQRAAQQAAVAERIREVKASESSPVTSVQELIRQSKQGESSPAPEGPTPMTPEQVRELKGSQVQ